MIYNRVNKTLGAMTGLVMDGIDVLGPVSGRIGMGYYDCYCKSPHFQEDELRSVISMLRRISTGRLNRRDLRLGRFQVFRRSIVLSGRPLILILSLPGTVSTTITDISQSSLKSKLRLTEAYALARGRLCGSIGSGELYGPSGRFLDRVDDERAGERQKEIDLDVTSAPLTFWLV